MEQNPPSQPNPDDSVSYEPESNYDVVQPDFEEIKQQERDAQARDEVLRAAVQRLSELRLAAAKDSRFDDEYQQAIDRVGELLREERQGGDPILPNEPSDS